MDVQKGSQNIEDEQICYGIVGNIPSELHSADVRAFFSQFVEEKGFVCFHYRHRPEVQRNDKQIDSAQNAIKKPTTCFCIVKMYQDKMANFIKAYNGQNWVDKEGKLFKEKALISKIGLTCTAGCSEGQYLTKEEKLKNVRTREEFEPNDLKKLPELNPPSIMPNGNVGTPLCVFIELIRKCKFPPHLIKKLGLTFPRSKKRKYGNVPFDYDQSEHIKDSDDEVDNPSLSHDSKSEMTETTESEVLECNYYARNTGDENNKRNLRNSFCDRKNPSGSTLGDSTESTTVCNCHHQKADLLQNSKTNKTSKCDIHFERESKSKSKKERMHTGMEKNSVYKNDSSDGEVEEWDRHEALHNDVTSQERTKERLFEDYIELKWEKGGSGLVWYTDAAFWKQQEEADFDEETVDDWDVDMSIYEEEGGGDMDAKALLQLRLEEQWRQGKDIDPNRVGSFEKYTRGIGGQVMRKQGWKEGQSLGSSQVGITEPISSDGQKPTSKRGLGYYGEKLNRFPKKPRPTREAVISTVYDDKDEKSSELFQSEGPFTIKYRDNIEFVAEKGTTSKN